MLPLHSLVPTSLICLQIPSDTAAQSDCPELLVSRSTNNHFINYGKTLKPERKRVLFLHRLTNSVKHEVICIKISKFSSYLKENITRIIFGDHVVNVSGKKIGLF
jgi:hypothetical protein